MHYSIILPVFNEEENILSIYDRVTEVVAKLSDKYEIIFVNDGSRDGTQKMLEDLHKKDGHVKVLAFSRNFGHQSAVSAGLARCCGENVAVMDADLQDPPEILPEFFAMLKEGYDTVYAVRTKRKESFVKRSAYSFFYRILQIFADISIPLDSGDFCVMNKRMVRALNQLPERNRFIRGLRSWVGYKQVGLAYERMEREAGDSKYSFSKLLKLAFDGIFSFSYVPLQAMFYAGLSALLFSGVAAVWVFYQKYYTDNYSAVPGFATTVILITFFGGLQLFAMGVFGEYMRRMFDEVKQRPQYIIEDEIGF